MLSRYSCRQFLLFGEQCTPTSAWFELYRWKRWLLQNVKLQCRKSQKHLFAKWLSNSNHAISVASDKSNLSAKTIWGLGQQSREFADKVFKFCQKNSIDIYSTLRETKSPKKNIRYLEAFCYRFLHKNKTYTVLENLQHVVNPNKNQVNRITKIASRDARRWCSLGDFT